MIQDKIFFLFKIIKEAFWAYRNKFLVMSALGILVGLFGGLGIGAVIPLFSFLLKDRGSLSPEVDAISQKIEQFFSLLHIDYNVFFLLGFMVLLFVAKSLLTYIASYWNERIATDYEKDVGKDLFRKTLEADWPYLMEQKTGHLQSILIQSVYTSSGILTYINSILMAGASLIMYAIVAFNISVPITLATMVLGGLIFLVLKPIFYRIRKYSHRLAMVSQDISHHVGENLMGAKTIKAAGSEDQIILKSYEYFEELKKARIKISLYNKATGSFLEPIGIIFVSILFIFYYYTDSAFNIASFAAIMYLVQKKITFIQTIQARFNNINEALPQLSIVVDYKELASRHKELNTGEKPFVFKDELNLKNISFAYNKDMRVLSDLNLSIKRGEMIGLIGPSGAGKTTLVDLLLRLFQPGSGEILIDSIPSSEIDIKDWRKKIGYVSQDIFLLNDTVENNIKFYNNQTRKEIIEVSKMANAYDFIEELPDKYQTILGERGIRLSAGQRQRIILARVLARKPEILILDEATSALDNESEALIQSSIENLKKKITVIAIAHRLSTVMNSDRLLVLEDGRIKEEGSPAELLKNKDSYFYKVYKIRET